VLVLDCFPHRRTVDDDEHEHDRGNLFGIGLGSTPGWQAGTACLLVSKASRLTANVDTFSPNADPPTLRHVSPAPRWQLTTGTDN
jgi:hypothetical protein